jgi:hypothetical protein
MKYLLLIVMTLVSINTVAQEKLATDIDDDDVTLLDDSVWHDKITGRRIHLQRLGGVDTLVYVKPNALVALAKDLGINAIILSWDNLVQNREWAKVTMHDIRDHFSHRPVLDNDSFSGNQFSHPYHGAMFYNAARNEGLSYGVSLLYPILGSASWEWLCETNAPAINDLLSTGVGGAAIGEVTHRTSDIFFDDSRCGANRVVRELIGTLLNPVRGVHRLISGEMWRVSPSRGKRVQPQPYSFEVGLGYRGMKELKGQKQYTEAGYLEFNFNYGVRFNPSGKSKPFDLFSMSLLTNLGEDHPTVGSFEIIGRLASAQIQHTHNWGLDVGFYQSVKYVDHYSKYEQRAHNFSIISEAVSFGGGLYAEHSTDKINLFNDFMISAVPFGGTNADYYPKRRYNFASGVSIRNNTQFYINQKATIGNKFYFARLYSLKGKSPEEMQRLMDSNVEIDSWGDQGNHSVITNNIFLQYNLKKNMRVNLDYQIYYRSSNYKYYSGVHAKSHEWKLGLIYSI